MNSLNLGGHSGCGIYLMEMDDGSVFVRKTSKDPTYNDRLQAQCAKQRSFVGKQIYAPAVLNEGIDEAGRFYFDMEYIQGVTLAEYIKTMEIGKIKGLVAMLVESLVPKMQEQTGDQDGIRACFQRKLEDLSRNLKDMDNSHVAAAIQMLKGHDWGHIPPSACHGDLTLENIIVRNDRLYLIDFLDSFYDSWVLDMGTLLQDVQAMWSYRRAKSVSMNTVLRLLVFRDLLLDAVRQMDPGYLAEIYYALLMKLVRIYPYTTDRLTLDFLDEKLEQVMGCIHMMEEGVQQ